MYVLLRTFSPVFPGTGISDHSVRLPRLPACTRKLTGWSQWATAAGMEGTAPAEGGCGMQPLCSPSGGAHPGIQ